jgi:flagellar basal body-associated protein FliL
MCSKEEQEGMVRSLKRMGWVRSVLVILSLIVGIATGVWALGEKVSANVKENVQETAKEVFVESLDEFHAEVQPEIMEGVDARIQIHALEESQKTQEALGQIKEEVAGNSAKLDILLQRQAP